MSDTGKCGYIYEDKEGRRHCCSRPEFKEGVCFFHSFNTEEDNFSSGFDGAVIEDATFWKSSRLEGCSFKNSFLLSVSFAGMELVNCDFTGAVFEKVRTRGWKPDSQTLLNTRYIYTGYKILECTDSKGGRRRVYQPRPESRVPAEGEFASGENEGFSFADFLYEPYKWTYTLQLPVQIRMGVIHYINFFSDFLRITHAKEVVICVRQEGPAVRIEFAPETKKERSLIEAVFKDYFNNISKRFEIITIEWNNPAATEAEKDLFKIKYENILHYFHKELKYIKRLLSKEDYYSAGLSAVIDILKQDPVSLIHDPSTIINPELKGPDAQDQARGIVHIRDEDEPETLDISEEQFNKIIEAFKALNDQTRDEIKRQYNQVQEVAKTNKSLAEKAKESLFSFTSQFMPIMQSLNAAVLYDIIKNILENPPF